MTSYSPVYRYNVDQALKHPWITRSHETKVPLTCQEMFHILDYEDKLKKVRNKNLLILTIVITCNYYRPFEQYTSCQ